MGQVMKRLLLAGSAVLTLMAITLLAVVGAGAWCMFAPAIPYSKMEQMRVGMAANDVTDLLGTPESRFSQGAGAEEWVYSRHTWAMYKVWIGPDRTVLNFEHDF
jgi:outer membrane protein assembly factor BamE (lipoprotein component of BamABCDE complex)